MVNLARNLYRFLASSGLACIVLLLLLLLTYLGTLYQTEYGLYEAQQRYFNSFVVIHYAFGVMPAPLPGAYLLLTVLFVNLLLGGIIRARKGWSKLGILIGHAGILILLVGGFITYEYSVSGYLKLHEGERSDMFESYTEWELALIETGMGETATEYVIHDKELRDAWSFRGVRYHIDGLPFDLHVSKFMENAQPRPLTGASAPGAPIVDGFYLEPLPRGDRGRALPGVYVALLEGQSEPGSKGIVWAGAELPLMLHAAGSDWVFELRRRRWQLPFTVALNQFTRELYPGTQIPKVFMSAVTKIEQGVGQDLMITMNQPLREHGYTLYQSSWGPENAPPGTRLYSVFAVVRNPADQFPLYACIIIMVGLTVHFVQKLVGYLRREATLAAVRLVVVAWGIAMGLVEGAGVVHAAQETHHWERDTLHFLATLPVLDEGRIKPLDTVANVRLLRFNGMRRTVNLEGRRITPIEWLADCLFFPERAKKYKTFRIDNDDVIVALGMSPEKKRGRYAYVELAPVRDRMISLARQYSGIPGEQRNPVQRQVIHLAHNLLEFERLCDYLAFARAPVAIPPDTPIAALFPEQERPPLHAMLEMAPRIIEEIRQARQTPGDAEAAQAASEAKQRMLDYIRAVQEQVGASAALRLIPPPAERADKEWFTPESLTDAAFSGETASLDESLYLLSLLEKAAMEADGPEKVQANLAPFHAAATRLAALREEHPKITLEVSYNRLQPFYYSLVLFVMSFFMVTFSWLLPRHRVMYAAGFLSVLLPTFLLAGGIAMRSVIRGRPPVTTLYETILFTAFVAVAVALFMEYVHRRRIVLAVASLLGTAGMFLAAKYEIREGVDTMPSMVAVLDTNFWLATHVTTIIMGYGASFLASALAHVYVFGRALRVHHEDPSFYRQLTRMIYGVLCFSLLFTMLGTILGGIWANESWGRFWGWDPKENGALMIVLWQLAVFHARYGGYLKDFGVSLAAIFSGVITAFAWFGVNLLGVGLHSYGFSSGTYGALLGFYIAQGLVLLLGAAVWTWEDKTGLGWKISPEVDGAVEQ